MPAQWTKRTEQIVVTMILGAVALGLFGRLASFGIWDPWELAAADLARQVVAGDTAELTSPPLSSWLVGQGFNLLGIHEWAGRLPMALMGLLTVVVALITLRRFEGRAAGIWAAVITGTSPLMLLNARQMLGDAPAFAASGAVFLCAAALAFPPRKDTPGKDASLTAGRLGAWTLGLVISSVLATLSSGVLLGVVPPLLAVALAIAARGGVVSDARFSLRGQVRLALTVVAAGITLFAGYRIWADFAGYGHWTGGVARGGNPPTWESGIEALFHAFAPWSALLPLAAAHMLSGVRERGTSAQEPQEVPSSQFRIALIAWVAMAFLAQSLFQARFGPATYLGVVGAAGCIAIWIAHVERNGRASWSAAIVVFLLVALIVRDYRAYPSAPIAGLAIGGFEVPEVFNPIGAWAALLMAFAALFALGLVADPHGSSSGGLAMEYRDLKKGWADNRRFGGIWPLLGVPTKLLKAQWARGVAFRIWLVLGTALLTALFAAGIFCWVPSVQLSSQVVRVGRFFVLIPFALPLAITIARTAIFAFGKFGRYRFLPALVLSLLVGEYTAHFFLPDLSAHFSPRAVYDTYNELADEGEPLGEFRVGGRAAAYYATGDVQELATQADLLTFLSTDSRVWAAFKADDLAAIDREYRRRAERHLFIANAESARMLLASNQPVEGMENQNYLAGAVLDSPPTPQHPIEANFDERIRLLGYDVEAPQEGYVGPGQSFSLVWYYQVLAPVPGTYRPFVHIDGPGQRINGDHDPVEGRYPVRLWEPGDVIVDRHELSVPANYGRGNLTIYMGFYSGESRLEVRQGPHDDVNRVRAGTLPIR